MIAAQIKNNKVVLTEDQLINLQEDFQITTTFSIAITYVNGQLVIPATGQQKAPLETESNTFVFSLAESCILIDNGYKLNYR